MAESEPVSLLFYKQELPSTLSYLKWSLEGVPLSWNVLESPSNCSGKAAEVSPWASVVSMLQRGTRGGNEGSVGLTRGGRGRRTDRLGGAYGPPGRARATRKPARGRNAEKTC